MLQAPDLDADAQSLADWLELEVLLRGRAVPIRDVALRLEVLEDHEPELIHHEDDAVEAAVTKTTEAVIERVRLIGEDYPFRLADDGSTISSLPWTESPGQVAYVLCLVLSQAITDGLLSDFLSGEDLRPAWNGHFQACAVVAGAGVTRGSAAWIGSPRPDEPSFLRKLQLIWQELNDGRVHADVPPGAPRAIKDGGSDVIAWSATADGHPPDIYLLGQAAAGANWPDKSIKGPVDRFHRTWFAKEPVTPPTICLIIPFTLPTTRPDMDFESQEAILGEIRGHYAEFGTMYYRYRIPGLVRMGREVAEHRGSRVEGVDRLGDVQEWASSVIAIVRDRLAFE